MFCSSLSLCATSSDVGERASARSSVWCVCVCKKKRERESGRERQGELESVCERVCERGPMLLILPGVCVCVREGESESAGVYVC